MADRTRLFRVSHSSLRILAALVWHAGSAVLIIKGSQLLVAADALQPAKSWPWITAGTGVLIGGIKAKFIFSRGCRKNLHRIKTLDQPRLWQFFRPGFFAFLALMILAGTALSRLAHGSYPLLLGVAGLDLSIATALLLSGLVFWKPEP